MSASGTQREVSRPPGADNKLPPDSKPPQMLDSFWWQLGQGSRSLGISGLALGVVLAADLIHPGHMKPWQVSGSLRMYCAGVLCFFRIERQNHRKGRASLPLDVSGGGRFTLVTAALVFCFSADPAAEGFAGWLAFAALLVGGASDGAWIALVATRRGVGFWRAWYQLCRREREAGKHCWAALFGKGER
ncbi:MAG: hypothetical protein OYH76_01210 [Defluviicoccus sp.]|nr:hypothetical protein [Defluviicoccus sp.]MDE0274482.1 hypothetical protein [Defluviicoccus sp.]